MEQPRKHKVTFNESAHSHYLTPVRSGLVADAMDWEWSSARSWAGCKDVPMAMDAVEFLQ